jgi:hypothetical protein
MIRKCIALAVLVALFVTAPMLHAEIGGFTLGSTTLTADNLILSNTGNITVGTGNNVARLSDDSTIRLWVGHATAASAPFRVEQDGDVFADDLTIDNLSAASGAITIDSSGLTFTAGTGSEDQIKWTNGVYLQASGSDLILVAPTTVYWTVGGNSLWWDGTTFTPNNSNVRDLGESTTRGWRHLFMEGDITVGSLAGTGNDHVCVDSGGKFFRSDSPC